MDCIQVERYNRHRRDVASGRFLLWLLSESSKAHSGIYAMAIIIPFVPVFGYVFGAAELERYKEIQKKDHGP
jgi:hypothetical protein